MAKMKHSPFGIISLVASLLALMPFPLVALLYGLYDLVPNKNEFIHNVLSSLFVRYSYIIVFCSIGFVVVTFFFNNCIREKR